MVANAYDGQEALDLISRHCPKALSTYITCINRADANGRCAFNKTMVDVEMSEEWHQFKKNIKALARENLLEWQPIDEEIVVTLAL